MRDICNWRLLVFVCNIEECPVVKTYVLIALYLVYPHKIDTFRELHCRTKFMRKPSRIIKYVPQKYPDGVIL